MPPTPADVEAATNIVERIAQAGLGRVRRVVMIGSRALGTAKVGSDLDLVVLVELPAGADPWSPADNQAERNRILRRIGPTPLRTDLWVRTTDRYEEARGVVGGPEFLAESEGVVVYSRVLHRPPVVRCSADQVRRQNVGTWIEHALLAADQAARFENGLEIGPENRDPQHSPEAVARAAIQRAITALLVFHQISSHKRDGIGSMLSHLARLESRVASQLRAGLGNGSATAKLARAVVNVVVHRLMADDGMRPYLNQVLRDMSKPLVLLRPG